MVDLRQHLVLSLKAAIAAALAWLLVLPMWGFADDYPYYAPLGAVISVTATVAGSVRESVQSIAAILTGAALAVCGLATDFPIVLDIAFVVGVGTVLSGWRRFGNKAAWVPISGLFVLIVGRQDPLDYAFAYVGLTGLGALVGILLNVTFPPLALSPMADSVDRLRAVLADQLDGLADGLDRSEPLTLEEWREREHQIRPTTEQMQRVVGHATDGRRANWRARRWNEAAEQRYQQARALQQVAFLIEDITSLVVEQERAERKVVALGPHVRPYASRALAALADVLRSVEADTADPDLLRTADKAVVDLADAIREERQRSSHDMFAAGTVVAGARRALASLVPEDLRDELPSDW